MDVITGKENSEVLEYLLKRRSAKVDNLAEPGPSKDEVGQILTAATRVPDHGKMCPWYSIVFEGQARIQVGELIAQAYLKSNPDAAPSKVDLERGRFTRAPLVVALISRARKGKKPVWEQVLSGGAAGMNLSLAAHSLGYGVQWLTEWYAFDEDVKAGLGLDDRDHVIGFFFIGTCEQQEGERDRPDLSKIVTYWTPDAVVNKGDCYDVEKLGFPELGFDFSKIYEE
jgi:nitroreductase